MKLRKRVIGDIYLAASVIFIFTAFLYFVFNVKGCFRWTLLIIGLIIAFFGIKTKNIMAKK